MPTTADRTVTARACRDCGEEFNAPGRAYVCRPCVADRRDRQEVKDKLAKRMKRAARTAQRTAQ